MNEERRPSAPSKATSVAASVTVDHDEESWDELELHDLIAVTLGATNDGELEPAAIVTHAAARRRQRAELGAAVIELASVALGSQNRRPRERQHLRGRSRRRVVRATRRRRSTPRRSPRSRSSGDESSDPPAPELAGGIAARVRARHSQTAQRLVVVYVVALALIEVAMFTLGLAQ